MGSRAIRDEREEVESVEGTGDEEGEGGCWIRQDGKGVMIPIKYFLVCVKDFGIGFFGYVALCPPKDEMGWGYIVDPGFVMYDSLSSPEDCILNINEILTFLMYDG